MSHLVDLLLCAVLLITLVVGLALIALGWLLLNGTLEKRRSLADRPASHQPSSTYP